LKLNFYLLKSTVVAALGGLLFGFDTAVISGTTSGLTQTYTLSPGMLGLTVSIALWGTVAGSLLAGIPGDRYGRRDSLRIMAVLYLISALGCAGAWNWDALVLFRFIGGLGIGGSSVLGPMYIAEIAPASWRGRLVGFFQFNVVFGILLAYLSNYVIGLQHLGLAEWRGELGVTAIPAAFFFLMLFTIPRSPRWLVKKQRIAEAREVLKMTGEPNFEQELAEISASIDAKHGHADEPLFSAKYRLPIFLAVSIAFFNQFSGINAILYYLNDIFADAGFNKVSGGLQTVIVGLTNLIFTMIAMSVIDKFGRKKLLLIGAVGTAACLFGVAAIFATGRRHDLLIWLYISEVFPNRVRAKGQSLGSFTHWIMAALISLGFPALARWSKPLPFVFFAAITVVQFFVVLLVYPETKGVSLEKIQKELSVV
jgi:sugar porter (SP) family MFS transporter